MAIAGRDVQGSAPPYALIVFAVLTKLVSEVKKEMEPETLVMTAHGLIAPKNVNYTTRAKRPADPAILITNS